MEDFASKLEVEKELVEKWESGEVSPEVEQIIKMANIFGVSTDYLIKGTVEQQQTHQEVKQETNSKKRIYRTNENKMICGVCSGLGEYFDIDPTLIRLAFVVISLFGGAGIIAYIVCALILPNKNEVIGK